MVWQWRKQSNRKNGLRALTGPLGPGRSTVVIHVHIRDLDRRAVAVESKDAGTYKEGAAAGNVIYDFTVSGGSGSRVPAGSQDGAVGMIRSPRSLLR